MVVVVLVVVVSFFFLLIGRENASPWKETDKLLVEVMSIFAATDSSVTGGRRRSTDWDRLGSEEGVLVKLEARGSSGEGYRLLVLSNADEEEEVVEEVE